jgi:hypothetical protein
MNAPTLPDMAARIQWIRGMCSDEVPYPEIDAALAALLDTKPTNEEDAVPADERAGACVRHQHAHDPDCADCRSAAAFKRGDPPAHREHGRKGRHVHDGRPGRLGRRSVALMSAPLPDKRTTSNGAPA